MRSLSLAAAAACLTLTTAARAAPQVRLGADYLLDGGPGLFLMQLGFDTPLARSIAVGGRFGALLTTDPVRGGVPLDLNLRVRISRAYLEGLVGPWIFFSNGDALRAHAAFGFGLTAGRIELGGEVGWLSDTHGMVGLRLGVRI